MYEGYVAVRTQDYERGEGILMALYGQAELEDYVRLHVLNALAQACWYQTHYDRALAFYQELHTFARRTENRLYVGVASINMGIVYKDIGDNERGLELSLHALQIFRELHDEYREAHALYEVGNNAMQLGRWKISQATFNQSRLLYQKLSVVARLATLDWCQGFLYHMLSDEAQSESAYQRALELANSDEHGAPSVVMDSWFFLGFLSQTQERWREALDAYNQALDVANQLRNQHSINLIHYRRGNIFERQGDYNQAFAAYRQAIDGVEALRSATETEEIKIGLLGTTQQVYESMVLLCLEQGRQAEAFAYVERARSQAFLDALAKKLALSSAEGSPELYEAFDQPIATLAEVQARLPKGALLLEYFTIGVLPRGESLASQIPPENTRLREHLLLPPRTLIFAITRDGFEVHDAGLDPNTLRPQPGDPSPTKRLLRGPLLARFYNQLLAPVAHALQACDLLYLVPHGPLHHLPFAALGPIGGEPLLHSDGPALALAPSATVLLRSCLGRPPSHAAGLLALGYNDQDGEALRYAEAEARHVAALAGGLAIVGPQPKHELLLAEGRHARWLHFAGHAYFHPREALDSELVSGADERLSARAIIETLEFDADLVTLSACTSGVARVVAGDELLGLQRAFLYAGARAVLCTQWEAADFVALLLMDRFYADLRRGVAPAAALRDAGAALRAMTGRDVMATIDRWRVEHPAFVAALGELPEPAAEELDEQPYADPFWWAPFVLIGKAD
jgi:CHAT domain-containing protein/tetratricopeptide (TPR) repeat protein